MTRKSPSNHSVWGLVWTFTISLELTLGEGGERMKREREKQKKLIEVTNEEKGAGKYKKINRGDE